MIEEKDVEEELEKLKKVRKTMSNVCNQLATYEQRMMLHTKAIDELQDFVLTDRKAIKVLDSKVDKIERKYSKDVMFQWTELKIHITNAFGVGTRWTDK